MANWVDFRQCQECGYDLWTGEGERSCHNYDCAYLPQELDVFCPQCRFDFADLTGNPPCDDPATCAEGAEARSHVANLRNWRQLVTEQSGGAR